MSGVKTLMQQQRPSTLAVFSLFFLFASLTFSSALAEISFGAALFFYLLHHRPHWKESFSMFPKSLGIPLGVFLALVILSAVTSEYPPESARGFLKIFKQVAVYWMVRDLFRSSEALARFEKAFLILIAVLFVDNLFQLFMGRDLLRWKAAEASGAGIRLTGSFGAYGKMAAFFVLAIPYLAALTLRSWRGKNKNFWFSLLLLAGSLGLLFLTKSRGAAASFFLGTVILAGLSRNWKFLGALFVAAALLVCILPRNMLIHLDADQKEQSLVERYYLWDRAVHVIEAKPWTGTGINTYAKAHAKYDKTQSWRVRNYYAHNGYLQLAAETGIPCVLALLVFFGVYLSRSFFVDAPGSEPLIRWGLCGGLLNFLIFSGVDTVFQSPLPIMTFWFLLGLQHAYLEAGKASKV